MKTLKCLLTYTTQWPYIHTERKSHYGYFRLYIGRMIRTGTAYLPRYVNLHPWVRKLCFADTVNKKDLEDKF